VTPGTLGKQLSKLVTDIVRAQAQAPPPGFDPEQAQQLQAAAQQAAAAGEAAPAAGGEAALRGKLQDYVMLNERGQGETAPMSLDQLKEQVRCSSMHELNLKSCAVMCLRAPSAHNLPSIPPSPPPPTSDPGEDAAQEGGAGSCRAAGAQGG
jgi:hypothetical protein